VPTQTPEQWSSKLGFILATTGAAVGLGNIWKFPYMAGTHGGSAFVLTYIICVLVIGVPLMFAEMLIGRLGQHNPVNSLSLLAKRYGCHPCWSGLGWLGAGTLWLVLAFYSVVAGWSIHYLMQTLIGTFQGLDAQQVHAIWQAFMASPIELTGCHSAFMLMTLWVVNRGVQQGLERASKYMMPCLFGILIVLVGYGASLAGFHQAWHFLFDVHLQDITTSVIISAMGHAFFTLAVGAGCILVYGAYVPKNQPIGSSIAWIVSLDVLVAVLAGMAIFPLVFTYHLPPQAGPGLMFEALPVAFAQMGGGIFFGALFFLLLIFAAWTSSISLAEPLVMMLIERTTWSRRTASLWVGGSAWLMGLLCLMSFNVLHHVLIFQHWDIFGAITDLTTNLMLPIGGLGFAWFAGRCIPTDASKQALQLGHTWLFKAWHMAICWWTPLGILLILLQACFG
jgi:neurotransmitter:Na+ symporter, NSS family